MNSLKKLLGVGSLALAALAFGMFGSASQAQAHHGHYHGHYHSYYPSYGYHYQAPVHYHSTYHADYSHWTPSRGFHTHGHYHVTPHYGW